MTPADDPKPVRRIVMFSGGIGSWAAAKVPATAPRGGPPGWWIERGWRA